MRRALTLHFLGTGNAHADELGSSSAVVEDAASPILMIDCGPDSIATYMAAYEDQLPEAVFITHTHMDHIGGLENLFYRAYFQEAYRGKIRLYVPVKLIDILQKRLADYPSILAEGNANFWDCFQLIPISDSFWHQGLQFSVFPVRHHQYLSAYGLSLPGIFLFTGDTCPIPEIINSLTSHNEMIFHDASTRSNPSHTCIHDVWRYYSEHQLSRTVFYHYESVEAGNEIEHLGYSIARPGQSFVLSRPSATYWQQQVNNHVVTELKPGPAPRLTR
jgi:ribonuclease BN (tRNA processing enzyme)